MQTAFMSLVPRKEFEEKVKVKIPRHEGTHLLSQHLEIKAGGVSSSVILGYLVNLRSAWAT